MTDKVQKIREEVARMHNLLPVMDGDNISVNYADRICTTLEMYIDSMQEEPESEDLEEAAEDFCEGEWDGLHDNDGNPLYTQDYLEYTFKAGAQWQKQQIMKDAVNGTIDFVERDGMCKPTILYEPSPNNKMQLGEKVKVIIIKQ